MNKSFKYFLELPDEEIKEVLVRAATLRETQPQYIYRERLLGLFGS